jgi:hypothetical protein
MKQTPTGIVTRTSVFSYGFCPCAIEARRSWIRYGKMLGCAKLHGRRAAEFSSPLVEVSTTSQASKALEGVPVATFPELFPGKQAGPISVPPESLDWQIFHIRLDEEVLIGLTVETLGARQIFEIGTFEGGTTCLLADKAGEGAEVFTLDLPEAEFA